MAKKREQNERQRFIESELEKVPKTYSTKSIARKVYKKHPEWFSSLDAALQAVRYARGAKGTGSRTKGAKKKTHRKLGKSGGPQDMPESLAEPWLPFKLDGPARVLSLSDIHIPYHDMTALQAAVDKGRSYNPTVVLLNGDTCDFYSISRWEKHPGHRNFKREIESIKQFLAWIRSQFKKVRIIVKAGNHEERFNKWIWQKAPELWDIPQCQLFEILELGNVGAEWVEDERPIMAGFLPIFHGHELPQGLTNPVNQARGAFLRTNDSTLTAHGHQTSSQPHFTWDKKEQFSWSQGCLCELHPKYARINKWNHGFAYIEVSANNEYEVSNYRIQGATVRRS